MPDKTIQNLCGGFMDSLKGRECSREELEFLQKFLQVMSESTAALLVKYEESNND